MINAETGGGTIDVGTVGSDVSLRTGGGNIKVMAKKGRIGAESGGGNVRVVSGMQEAVLELAVGTLRSSIAPDTSKPLPGAVLISATSAVPQNLKLVAAAFT